jgi:nucleoside-diphosphate-sugar epimerase
MLRAVLTQQEEAMSHHLVLGAGPVGSGTALRLAELGHDVTIATRSGSGPSHPSIRRMRVDASDGVALAALAEGAATIVNAINPAYHRWPTDWPPIHRAVMAAAERSGAAIVLMDNLYPYEADPANGPIHEHSPIRPHGPKGEVRAEMRAELLVAHASGRVQAATVHASDYFGPGVVDAVFGARAIRPILAGKTVRALGDLDVEHSWSYMPDVTATLVRVASDSSAWGRAWHVPSAPPVSTRELTAILAQAAGKTVKIASIPRWAIKAASPFVAMLRELEETRYQFELPFVIGDDAARRELGLTHTPIEVAARATIDAASMSAAA